MAAVKTGNHLLSVGMKCNTHRRTIGLVTEMCHRLTQTSRPHLHTNTNTPFMTPLQSQLENSDELNCVINYSDEDRNASGSIPILTSLITNAGLGSNQTQVANGFNH